MSGPWPREEIDMTRHHNQAACVSQLCKPVLTIPQLEELTTRTTIPVTRHAAVPWYVALWRGSVILTMEFVCGIALGLVFVVIAHYTGLEEWMNTMVAYQ
jgi:hypothetical protein